MSLVEMYSKDNCHLCDEARKVLDAARSKIPFELNIIKLKEGDAEFEMYKERFPVIFINKEFAFQFKVSEHQLMTRLLGVHAG
ncbi:MAG: glutaredoxin family protein [Bacteroidota bacterium]